MPIGMSKQAWFNTITEPIVKDGLIFRVDAGNSNSYPGSGTTWFDLSPNANNGTLTNGPTFNSDNKGSIVFDGSNDYVDFGNSSVFDVGNNITIVSWFRVGSVSVYQPIIAKVKTSTNGWEFANSSGRLRVTLRGTTNVDLLSAVSSLSLNNWYMGAFSYNGTTTRLYINETQVNSSSSGSPTMNSDIALRIGTRTTAANYYNGRISVGYMYNRQLTADEISQNFNALRYRYGI